jgi:hypothetical protein
VPISSLTTLLIPRSIVVHALIIVFTVTGLIVAIVARRTRLVKNPFVPLF